MEYDIFDPGSYRILRITRYDDDCIEIEMHCHLIYFNFCKIKNFLGFSIPKIVITRQDLDEIFMSLYLQ